MVISDQFSIIEESKWVTQKTFPFLNQEHL
jgi:hypothetical protein